MTALNDRTDVIALTCAMPWRACNLPIWEGEKRVEHHHMNKLEEWKKALSAGPLLALDVPMTKDGLGCCFILIFIWPKWEKALSAGPLLALDVPMTKDSPGCFILIHPMLHVYQPKEVIICSDEMVSTMNSITITMFTSSCVDIVCWSKSETCSTGFINTATSKHSNRDAIHCRDHFICTDYTHIYWNPTIWATCKQIHCCLVCQTGPDKILVMEMVHMIDLANLHLFKAFEML
jgi:hypothetical protein